MAGIPLGAGGFRPDPDAWTRYGDLVKATLAAAQEAARGASELSVAHPARGCDRAEAPEAPAGYGARGSGDLCDQVAQLSAGETSVLAEVDRAIASAQRKDGALRAVVALEADRARAEARRLDVLSPAARGVLAGAPYARKDLFLRQGFAAECGAPLFSGRIAQETATVLTRLDAAGGVDIGRLAMAELAMSPTGFNAHARHPRNPWDPAYATGGSSSGSGVAVAAGYVRAALGTDTGGSVRHPAAMSGVTGLKPTESRISRAGVWPLSWSLDCVGPLARSARDCALLLEVMSGPDTRDPTVGAPGFRRPALTGDLTGLRIAAPAGYYAQALTPAVAEALVRAQVVLAAAGAEITPTQPPDMSLINAMAHLVLAVEASAQLGAAFAAQPCVIGRQVRDRLEPGMFYPAAAYATALRVRAQLRAQWITAAMAGCDAALLPAIPRETPTIAETTGPDPVQSARIVAAVTHATRGVNYLGLPALVAPCGADAAGLPLAIQLVGRPDDEATLIQIADAYQRRTDWHVRRPPERTPS